MKLLQPLLFALGISLACGSAWAEVKALLIGVSGYPGLPAHKRLSGPRTDVVLMEAALRTRGVRHIELLADGVMGSQAEPTRAEIDRALERLTAGARPGDWLIIYFSGHGTQQPQSPETAARGWREPDSRDEIFLPLDVGRWQPEAGSVANALLDDRIGSVLTGAVRRGASVWAIFDTCHAGDMAKAVPGTGEPARVFRGIVPELLGIPPAPRALGGGKRFPLAAHAVQAKGGPLAGRVIAFYATQPNEPAPEEALAPPIAGSTRPRMAGLFTWHLTRLLESQREPVRFEQLMHAIQARYRAENRPFPNPMLEGPGQILLPF